MEINKIKILCEDVLKDKVLELYPITGGDINLTYQIETEKSNYFCKINSSAIGEDLLQKEEHGLNILQRYCNVPAVVASAPKILILDWIISAKKNKKFWQDLGRGLADIHKITSNKFGLDQDNYVGTLPQSNTYEESWSSFYVAQRLEPQIKMAVDQGLLTLSDISNSDMMEKIVKVVCPNEPATLIHGDLWSGNILCNENNEAFFVDPCTYYGHREMDIAMSSLFGKFDSSFYEAYNELRPLETNFKDRLDIYQLYYLLAHLNMFGIGYKNDVLKVLKRYFQ